MHELPIAAICCSPVVSNGRCISPPLSTHWIFKFRMHADWRDIVLARGESRASSGWNVHSSSEMEKKKPRTSIMPLAYSIIICTPSASIAHSTSWTAFMLAQTFLIIHYQHNDCWVGSNFLLNSWIRSIFHPKCKSNGMIDDFDIQVQWFSLPFSSHLPS